MLYCSLGSLLPRYRWRSALTVGSYRNPGGQREKEHKDDVGAEEEPSQGRQVEEPGGRVGVEGLVEQVLEVSLPLKGPDGPQTLQRDDEVGENGATSWRIKDDNTVYSILDPLKKYDSFVWQTMQKSHSVHSSPLAPKQNIVFVYGLLLGWFFYLFWSSTPPISI